MPSFTLYDLNPEFWAQVQAKAARDGITVKALILKLLAAWLAAVLVLSLGACAYHSPDAPTPVPAMADDVPSALTLTAITGVGPQGGHSTITALVSNLHGAALPHVMVHFATDAGTIAPLALETGDDGTAATTITGVGTATVTAHAGAITTTTRVANQALPVPPPAPPEPGPTPSPMPSPTPNPTPAPPAPAGALSVTISAQGAPLNVTVAASVTNGPAVLLVWTWGDGTAFTGSSTTSAHTYASAGTYELGLTVTDAIGRTARATTTATVLPIPPPPPPAPVPPAPPPALTATLTVNHPTVALNGTLDFAVTLANKTALETMIAYRWDLDGDGQVESTTTGPTRTSGAYKEDGLFTAHVTVTLSSGRTAVGSVSFVVTN
jgi:PKD repeat protein